MNVAPIKRGSLYLTDDYVQAMSYNQPARISSFALLNLPTWSTGNMFIEAAELGMPAGTVSPNDILPAVFQQYWLNLCAYARQYHAQLDYGEDVEDFAEQAFWKMMMRIMPWQSSPDDMLKYVVAKSTDILQNTNSIDGNMFSEILLNVNSTIKKQEVTFEETLPTYLQTIGRFPSVSNPNMLGSHNLALYDKDKTYYDLSASQCFRAKFADADEGAATFAFNAILLYYELADVEQIAGIFFPNAFAKNAADVYALPTITKQSDISLGYSINIRYVVGEGYEYNASNADSGLAMQVYNDWYRAMSRMNVQYESLAKRMLLMEQDLNEVQSAINGGYLQQVERKLSSYERLIGTTFKGSVSTNKLLELFTAAKNNTGQLSLSLMMSDLSKAVISRDIRITRPIGAYKEGEVINMGEAITDILAKMLQNETIFKYVQPSGAIMYNGQTGTVYVDYHSITTIALAMRLVQADAGSFVFPASLYLTNNGIQQTAQIIGIDTVLNFTLDAPIANPVVATTTIQYSEGTRKDGDEDINNVVKAGLLNLDIRIVPVYNAYIGSIEQYEDFEGLTADTILTYRMFKSNQLAMTYTGATDYQIFACPKDCSNPVVNQVTAMNEISIDGVEYNVYCIKARSLTINTANLQ